jgi:SNF2 family DNA or RNA helicase
MKQAKLTTPKEREKLDEPNRYYAVEDEVPRPLRFVIGAKASVASMHDDPPPPMMKGQKSSLVSSKDDIIDDFDDYDQEAPLNDSFNEDVRFIEDTRTQAAFAADALLLSEEGKLPRIEVPEKINRLLHPYQRDGVRFLYSLYVEKHGGILADDMGMGKTVQTISFVVAIKGGRAAEPSMFFKTKSSLVLTEPALPLTTKPILVVCPASVLQNWHTEFHRWARLRVFIAHAKVRDILLIISFSSH